MSMSTPPVVTSTGRTSKLAVVAIVMAVIAIAGLWLLGVGGLAVFAVGAGHVSLNQIKLKGERGRWLAVAALCIGYVIAAMALVTSLSYIPALVQQVIS